ncbi:hypothetical protein Tco_0320806 [Tanacetum coccineum]
MDSKVAERECEEMHIYESTRKSKCYEPCEEILREIMEIYKLEGGENEKSYLREDGNRKIAEILAEDEGVTQISLFAESGKNKNCK